MSKEQQPSINMELETSGPDQHVIIVHKQYPQEGFRSPLCLNLVTITTGETITSYKNWDLSQPYSSEGVLRLNAVIINKKRKTTTIAFESINGEINFATYRNNKSTITIQFTPKTYKL